MTWCTKNASAQKQPKSVPMRLNRVPTKKSPVPTSTRRCSRSMGFFDEPAALGPNKPVLINRAGCFFSTIGGGSHPLASALAPPSSSSLRKQGSIITQPRRVFSAPPLRVSDAAPQRLAFHLRTTRNVPFLYFHKDGQKQPAIKTICNISPFALLWRLYLPSFQKRNSFDV